MTDKDTIYKLYDTLKVGNICYRENKRNDGRIRKPSWILSIQKHEDIIITIHKIKAFLSYRRLLKVEEILDELRRKELGVI
jgi:hypothetical protein